MAMSVCGIIAVLALFPSTHVQARLGGGTNSTEAVEVNEAAVASEGESFGKGSLADDLQQAKASMLDKALARGGPARSLDYWANASLVSTAAVDYAAMHGHEYLATTTRYADTCCASCGKVDTAALVAGTSYYAVASAQAMQNLFAQGSCCWCGAAGAGCGHGSGTAPMGCSACARARFLPKRPYESPVWGSGRLFEKDIDIVVADICPYVGNEAWCPHQEGSSNRFGSKNHFDFANPPPEFDNFYLAFTPAPCSAEMQQRLASMSQCR
mmetsp:Transcript_93803/g.235516  ORF Transcript_93803/g.235516 Transcript_93803/m.235516 type:complete len:269 (-) Transcript_93803:452-1258(-)|eukprot:CAMPEP_0115213004 /NCGR_PEP_ID=MMETSP0270-20121206/23575_1 /TAXON_ID=71861 /ORGANISM="Scrippsiella trochoidea, Strain CCMP3099" /LENGTH=268 /DNA_ID=CAMNT_0002626749 /DNA_START=85 /DNA_END=891 /DNA_ORIENTATION=+